MSRHFAAIAYTPAVRAEQRRYNGAALELGAGPALAELGNREREFIAARDSCYLATVGESGWPHVQHRGGPPGFLQAVGAATLAFADYNGNRQYVSVGNLGDNDRAALILIDYPNRRRLKILGRVQVADAADAAPDLLAALHTPSSGEPPAERILLIRVAAFDWNCSRHITPRFTESELLSREIPRSPSPSPSRSRK